MLLCLPHIPDWSNRAERPIARQEREIGRLAGRENKSEEKSREESEEPEKEERGIPGASHMATQPATE